MLADTTNEPRTVEEGYASATGASHLRIEAHRSGAGDVIAAAGMSPYRMGMALMRLRSEWDRAAKPKAPGPEEVQAAAKTLPIEPSVRRALVQLTNEQVAGITESLGIDKAAAADIDWRATIEFANPHAGLVSSQSDGETKYRKPQREAEILAHRWYEHELGLLLQGLKSLPAVRVDLERWVGGDDAPRMVAEVLTWWLDPVCRGCGGCGKRIVQGTGGRSSGKPCPDCRYSSTTGQRKTPFGGAGRKLAAHLNACYFTAVKELRQTLKGRRSTANVAERDEAKKHAQIAKLRRADEEAKRDAAADHQAAASKFEIGS